jgi:hypothetical protein
MRYAKQTSRFLMAALALTVCFSLGAAPAWAQATTTGKTTKCPEPTQGQQLCPPATTSGQSLCSVSTDCPPAQSSGQTLCQPGADCPPAKPEKPAKKKK